MYSFGTPRPIPWIRFTELAEEFRMVCTMYFLVLHRLFFGATRLTHEQEHHHHQAATIELHCPPLTATPTHCNPIIEVFPPLNLIPTTRPCCIVLPKVLFSLDAAVTRAVEVEESQYTCPSSRQARCTVKPQVTAKSLTNMSKQTNWPWLESNSYRLDSGLQLVVLAFELAGQLALTTVHGVCVSSFNYTFE